MKQNLGCARLHVRARLEVVAEQRFHHAEFVAFNGLGVRLPELEDHEANHVQVEVLHFDCQLQRADLHLSRYIR